jgi:DNA-binding beta-propeller fold protein YncE
LALVLAACGRADRAGTPSTASVPPGSAVTSVSSSSTDQLVLRFPRVGGRVRAYAFPRLDSVVWTSNEAVPALERVLAFDDEAGSVLGLDVKGAPVRVDLRLGGVTRERRPLLTRVASSDGRAVYGVSRDGKVIRLTPGGSGPWTYTPPQPAREVLPQANGSLIVVTERGGKTTLLELHPPQATIMRAAVLPRITGAAHTEAGDRIYFAVDTGVIGVRGRDLSFVPSVRLEHHVHSLVTTPSGDRVYVASDSSRELPVIDRYGEHVEVRIALPGTASDLRMDPTGRYLLARPSRGDSVWVIALGTDRVIGAAPSAWRSDLPAVAPNGAIALLRGLDVVFADGETLAPLRRVSGGARDLWYFIVWNGFHPRVSVAEEIGAPRGSDSVGAPVDSARAGDPFAGQVPGRDTAAAPVPAAVTDTAGLAPPAPPDTARVATAPEFTVQFAALREENAARVLASAVRTSPASPRISSTVRVVASVVAGSAIYRVVAGPFRTRDEAERAAQPTGRPYWVYEGVP